MTTIKFEIVSDKYGHFDLDSSSYSDDQLNCYITRDQYLSIVSKINERIQKFKHATNVPCLIGVIIIILCVITFVFVQIESQRASDIYGFIVVISIITITTVCCAACDKFSGERSEIRFRKLQSDIQTIADEEFMTVYRIAYAKWMIDKVDDRTTGNKFKLTAEFRLQQQRTVSTIVTSVDEPMDGRPIQMYPANDTMAYSTLVLDLEQTTAPIDDGQDHAQYTAAPATPPPPSYHKVVHVFSQGIFTDCPNCSNKKCVLNGKYCTQCGYSLLIQCV